MSQARMAVNLWENLKATAPKLICRAVLLGSIAGSLALVGGQTVTQPHAAAQAAIAARVAAGEAFPLSLATGLAGAVRHTVDTWSDGSIEAVSLFVLGLSLIGAGQVLAGVRRRKQDARSAQASARSQERPYLNAQSLAEFREALSRRAAR